MRCATSGRLTPAAATLTRTWPAPGVGVGMRVAFKTSGPPGAVMATAVIVAGVFGMCGSSCGRAAQGLAPDMPEAEG